MWVAYSRINHHPNLVKLVTQFIIKLSMGNSGKLVLEVITQFLPRVVSISVKSCKVFCILVNMSPRTAHQRWLLSGGWAAMADRPVTGAGPPPPPRVSFELPTESRIDLHLRSTMYNSKVFQ